MTRLVKCPICSKLIRITRIQQKLFCCCGIRHEIDSKLVYVGVGKDMTKPAESEEQTRFIRRILGEEKPAESEEQTRLIRRILGEETGS